MSDRVALTGSRSQRLGKCAVYVAGSRESEEGVSVTLGVAEFTFADYVQRDINTALNRDLQDMVELELKARVGQVSLLAVTEAALEISYEFVQPS